MHGIVCQAARYGAWPDLDFSAIRGGDQILYRLHVLVQVKAAVFTDENKCRVGQAKSSSVKAWAARER